MIDCVIEALGLDVVTVNGKANQTEAKPLVKETDGEVAHGDFSYSSVVGMMLYRSDHLRLDIAYDIKYASCYMFCPRHSDKLALKRIIRYQKAICSR